MAKIRIGDLKFERAEKEALFKLINTDGRITEGEYTKKFEKRISEYVGTRYATGVNSGTSALLTALLAIKYSSQKKNLGEYIITSPLTYPATINAILFAGFKPLFVDIEDNFCISTEKIEDKLVEHKENISGILPVHLLGFMADMAKIKKISERHNLFLVEDCAESFGSMQKNKNCGSFGDASIFSFFASHTIGVGELGCMLTNNPKLYELANEIKDNGRRDANGKERCNFLFDSKGLNFKTTEFSSLLGYYKLGKVKQVIQKRQENVKFLNDAFEKISDNFILPEFSKDICYFSYPLIIKNRKFNRLKIIEELYKSSIEARTLFGCLPTQQKAFSEFKSQYSGKLPNSESVGKNAFYLPCHQYLTKENLNYLADAFLKIVKE